MQLVLLGPPGAGKGVHSDRLSECYNIPHISCGDILRERLSQNDEISLKLSKIMNQGKLVSDDIVMKLIEERLKKPDAADGFILDGFPRTIEQAKKLEELLEKKHIKLDKVIYLNTSLKVSIQRLGGRRVCSKCAANYHIKNMPPEKPEVCDRCGSALYVRDDDQEETVRSRWKVYKEKTASLIDFYKGKDLLWEVPGDLSADEVFSIIAEKLNALKK